MSVWKRPRPARAGESTRAAHFTYAVRWRLGGTRDGKMLTVTVGHTRGHAAQAAALDTFVASQGGNVNKAEAVAWLKGQAAPEGEPEGDDEAPTVRAAIEAWIARPGKTDQSRRTYGAVLGRLGDLGEVRANTLTKARVNAWFKAWEDHGLSHSTLWLTRITLKGACAPYCGGDVFAEVRYAVQSEVEVVILTREQVAAAIAAARCEGMALPVWFVAELGVRWGEMAGVTAGDIDLARGTVHINKQVPQATTRREGFTTRRLKTKRSRRTLKMSAELTEALALVADLAPGEPVFAPPYADSWCYDGWRKAWGRVKTAAGLPAHTRTHDLRHTAAMRWLRGGVQLPMVSRMLGHSSVKVTDETYSHWLESDLDAVLTAGLGVV